MFSYQFCGSKLTAKLLFIKFSQPHVNKYITSTYVHMHEMVWSTGDLYTFSIFNWNLFSYSSNLLRFEDLCKTHNASRFLLWVGIYCDCVTIMSTRNLIGLINHEELCLLVTAWSALRCVTNPWWFLTIVISHVSAGCT